MAVEIQCLSDKMNAKIVGSGSETMVLAYGYGCDQSIWDKIVGSLSMRFKVLVFDWSFSGAIKDKEYHDLERYSNYEAFAADLISLMDEMNIKSSVYVGHSMSGMIGSIASTMRPDLFHKLVFIGASPRYVNAEDYEGGFKETDIEGLLSSMEQDYNAWTYSFSAMLVGVMDPASTEQYRICLTRMQPQVALSVAKVIFLGDYRQVLDHVTAPCVFVQTKKDNAVPKSVGYYMKGQVKGKAEVVELDATDHYPHLTAPQKLLDVLTNLNTVFD